MDALPFFLPNAITANANTPMPSHMPRTPHRNDRNDEIYSFDCAVRWSGGLSLGVRATLISHSFKTLFISWFDSSFFPTFSASSWEQIAVAAE